MMSSTVSPRSRRQNSTSEKYIPWEPYRAATSDAPPKAGPVIVQPISTNLKFPYKLAQPVRIRKNKKQPEIDDQNLHKPEPEVERCPDDPFLIYEKDAVTLEKRYEDLRICFEKLRAEKIALEVQAEMQNNVNTELKKLLVATMGDDLQLHLESLSHDKVQLAHDIVEYTEKVTEGHENIDQLAIQCDIWRSKFLASSVMVDELLGWRAFLIDKFSQTQQGLSNLMEEHKKIRTAARRIFILLNRGQTLTNCDKKETLLDQMIHIEKIVQNLTQSSPEFVLNTDQMEFSEAEKRAIQLLSIDKSQFYAVSPCDEIRQATRKKYTQMIGFENCHLHNITISCCKKCTGKEIQLV